MREIKSRKLRLRVKKKNYRPIIERSAEELQEIRCLSEEECRLLLSRNLRQIRVEAGYSQQEIAELLEVNRSTYSYYELGKTLPSLKILYQLSLIFRLPVGALLNALLTAEI